MHKRKARKAVEASVERHYSVKEVAELLGVGETIVREYITVGRQTKGTEGIYPAYRFSPRIIRVPASAIHVFRENCKL
jgi:transposase